MGSERISMLGCLSVWKRDKVMETVNAPSEGLWPEITEGEVSPFPVTDDNELLLKWTWYCTLSGFLIFFTVDATDMNNFRICCIVQCGPVFGTTEYKSIF